MSKEYVLGFLFDPGKEWVVLIQKKRPTWQAGLLNGVGGRLEQGEQPSKAMEREFEEETGLNIPATDWVPFCTMNDRGNVIFCFYATSPDLHKAKTMTDEDVAILHINTLFKHPAIFRAISNLSWLIRMAQDPNTFCASVEYADYPETETVV